MYIHGLELCSLSIYIYIYIFIIVFVTILDLTTATVPVSIGTDLCMRIFVLIVRICVLHKPTYILHTLAKTARSTILSRSLATPC